MEDGFHVWRPYNWVAHGAGIPAEYFKPFNIRAGGPLDAKDRRLFGHRRQILFEPHSVG